MEVDSSPTAGEEIAEPNHLKLVIEGAVAFVIGFAGLWLSFWLTGNAKAILGAGPLIGSGMIGFGLSRLLLGNRLDVLCWMVAVISSLIGIGVTIVLLQCFGIEVA